MYNYFLNIMTIMLPIIFLLKRGNKVYNLMILALGIGISAELNILDYISITQILELFLAITFIIKILGKEKVKITNFDKNTKIIFILYLLYIIYTIGITFIFYPSTINYKLIGGVLRNELRPIVQSIEVVIFFLSILGILCFFPRKKTDEIIKNYVYTVLGASILGIIQFVVYKIMNVNIFPMRSQGKLINPLFDNKIRISAMMGEPKVLAKFIVIAFTILIFSNSIKFKKKIVMELILLIALYLTNSATGFIMIIPMIIIYIITEFKKNKLKCGVIIMSAFLIVPVILNTNVIKNKVDYLDSDGGFRVIKKDGTLIGFEDTDNASINFLKNNKLLGITGIGVGNIPYFASNYIPKSCIYLKKVMYTMRRDIIKTICECGMIGLGIKITILALMYKKIRRIKEKNLYIVLIVFQLFCAISCCEQVFYYIYTLLYIKTIDRQEVLEV